MDVNLFRSLAKKNECKFSYPVDKTTSQCFFAVEFATRIAQFTDQALISDHFGAALQSTNISGQAQINLFYGEPGIIGAVTNVCGRY